MPGHSLASFRDFMGAAARPVYIAATTTTDGLLKAVTVNSVFSANVNPPHDEVGIVLRSDSSFLHSVLASRDFSVTLLNSGQVRIAEEFASSHRLPTQIGESEDWSFDHTVPILKEAHSSIAATLCSVKEIGKNTLLFGQVKVVQVHHGGRPLLYANRTFSFLEPDRN